MNASALPKKKRTVLGWAGVVAGFAGFLVIVLAIAFTIFMTLVDRHADAESDAKNIVDVTLPDFQLPLLNEPGKMVGKGDLLGAPYLITTWASWCYGCAHEHPALMRLGESGRVRLIGLNMQDDPADATTWLARHGNPFAMIMVDERGAVADRFGVMVTPHHILVDSEGNVRWRLRGPITDQRIDAELLPLLEKLRTGRLPPAGPQRDDARPPVSGTREAAGNTGMTAADWTTADTLPIPMTVAVARWA